MTVSRDEAYVKVLSRSLDRIIDLQRFGETKNASLLAFSSVWIAGLVNLLLSDRHPPPGFRIAGSIALVLFITAALTAIASLLPRFVAAEPPVEGGDGAGPNLLFFGDIAQVPVATFVAEARQRYYAAEGCVATETLFADLSRQIAIVSQISMRKYRLFNRAAAAALLGIGTLSVPVLGLLIDTVR